MAIPAGFTAGVRAWSEVATAVELVAEGHAPSIIVAGIPDAARVAEAIRPDAERCGVEVIAEPVVNGRAGGLTVRIAAGGGYGTPFPGGGRDGAGARHPEARDR